MYWRKVGAVLLIVVCTACSTFKRDWNQARNDPVSIQGMAGAWDGDWRSAVNHHHGRLQCLMTKESEGKYRARFHATFAKIFHSTYTVPLSVVESNGVYRLEGEADLGSLAGGTYKYLGQATPTNLNSTYQSKYDHGLFELKRPE